MAASRARSAANTPQRLSLMQCDVIGLVAFDLVLWIVLARMMDIAFVVQVARVHPHDTAAYSASFGIPSYVIADFECLCQYVILAPYTSSCSFVFPCDVTTGQLRPLFALPLSVAPY